MSTRRHVEWFLQEIPRLVRLGLLPEPVSAKLTEHYRAHDSRSRMSVASLVFSVLGALLVGGGIILILAHNWSDIPRVTRLVILFGVLIGSQGVVVYACTRQQASRALTEGASVFTICAFMATVALVSQIYQIPGDFTRYLLISALVTLPLLYVTRSCAAALMYCLLLIGWASASQIDGGSAMWFWPLWLALVPLLRTRVLAAPSANSTLILWWVVILSVVATAGISMEKVIPGLWMIFYASIFAIYYLYDHRHVPVAGGFWETPLRSCASVGGPVLLLLLTYEWPWKHIGWGYSRAAYQFHAPAAIAEYVLMFGALMVALLLLLRAIRTRTWRLIVYGAMPFVVACCFTISTMTVVPVLFIMNIYVLGLGIDSVMQGIVQQRLAWLNGGLALLMMLIMSRFFDFNMGLLERGIAFIVVGVIFIASNMMFRTRHTVAR